MKLWTFCKLFTSPAPVACYLPGKQEIETDTDRGRNHGQTDRHIDRQTETKRIGGGVVKWGEGKMLVPNVSDIDKDQLNSFAKFSTLII
jgi:hypothetical protein